MQQHRSDTDAWSDFRCQRNYKGKTCGRIIARGRFEVGELELECPRCRKYTILRASRPNAAPPDGLLGDRHALSQSAPR